MKCFGPDELRAKLEEAKARVRQADQELSAASTESKERAAFNNLLMLRGRMMAFEELLHEAEEAESEERTAA